MDPYKNENNENKNPVRETGEPPNWFQCARQVFGELRPAQYQTNDGGRPRRRVDVDRISRLVLGISFEEREVRTRTLTIGANGTGAWEVMNEEQPQEVIVEQELSAEEIDIQNRLNENIERGFLENAQHQQLDDNNQPDNQDELQDFRDLANFLPDNLPDSLDFQLSDDDQEN